MRLHRATRISSASVEDVVLLDEAHLDVELGELGLPVGAEVLVAVAARDLEVALHARDHQQLLEQLRALRQGVPAAGLQARRHQEVTRSLGGRPGQGRGLDLDEVVAVQDVAGGLVDLAPQAQRSVGAAAAQVEVAVLEAGLLPHVHVVVDGERQRRGRAEHLQVGRDDLDLAGGQGGVGVALGPDVDGAGDLDAVLVAQGVGDVLVADDDLDHAAGLTEVEEGHASVVAALGHPPGKGHGLACVLGAQGSGVMGADHGLVSSVVGPAEITCGRRSSVGGDQEAGSASTCSPDRMSLTWWVTAPSSAVRVNQT